MHSAARFMRFAAEKRALRQTLKGLKIEFFRTLVKCGGNHDETDCTADFERCVNCMNSTQFKDQCDHRADSPKCPVFLALREAELKNATESLTQRY